MDWATQNVSISERNYKRQTGTLVLPHGSEGGTIHVTIKDNPEWNVEAMMRLELTAARNIPKLGQKVEAAEEKKPVLGEPTRAAIYVLNDDKFPQGVEAKEHASGTFTFLNQLRLIHAFFAHFRVVLGPITLWGLFLKVQSTISWILVELLMLRTLEHGIPKGSDVELVLLGVAYLLNWLFSYVCDDAFRKLKLGGKALNKLRENLIYTAVQLSDAEANNFPPGRIAAIVEKEVRHAIDYAFMRCFVLWEGMIRCVCLFAWACVRTCRKQGVDAYVWLHSVRMCAFGCVRGIVHSEWVGMDMTT